MAWPPAGIAVTTAGSDRHLGLSSPVVFAKGGQQDTAHAVQVLTSFWVLDSHGKVACRSCRGGSAATAGQRAACCFLPMASPDHTEALVWPQFDDIPLPGSCCCR